MTISIGSPTLSSDNSANRVHPPKSSRIRNDKALMWLYENLLTQQLQTKLQCLLSDNEHLTSCYEVTLAFFGSKKFLNALYICLNAFNAKQCDILLQIDQSLYISVINESLKRCSVSTMNDKGQRPNASKECSDNKSTSKSKKCDYSSRNVNSKAQMANRRNKSGRSRCKLRHSISVKLRNYVSLPDLTDPAKFRFRNIMRSKSQSMRNKSQRHKLTVENLAINDRKIPGILISSRNQPSDHINNVVNELQPINLVKCDDIKIHTDRRADLSSTNLSEYELPAKSVGLVKSGNLLPYLNTSHGSSTESNSPGNKLGSNSAPGDFASFFAANGAKIENRYQSNAIFDNIESSTSSPLCNHEQCALVLNKGQSLTSYLQEAQRTRRNITDLERENAHFSLSDAIISAIEEIKCGQLERKREKQIKATSQVRRRKSHQRPLKKWIVGDDDNCDRNNVNATDDDTSSFLSEEQTSMSRSSSSGSDLSHISSSSDSSSASNAGGLKRLKVFTGPKSK